MADVGIGTPTPQRFFHVQTSNTNAARFESTGNQVVIELSDTSSTNPAKIGALDNTIFLNANNSKLLTAGPTKDKTGNGVGIATSTPKTQFEVNGSAFVRNDLHVGGDADTNLGVDSVVDIFSRGQIVVNGTASDNGCLVGVQAVDTEGVPKANRPLLHTGTYTPSSPLLQVNTDSGNAAVASMGTCYWRSDNTAGPYWNICKSRSGAVGQHNGAVLEENDYLGNLHWLGGHKDRFRIGASIRARVENPNGLDFATQDPFSSYPTDLEFRVGKADASGMRTMLTLQSDNIAKFAGAVQGITALSATSVTLTGGITAAGLCNLYKPDDFWVGNVGFYGLEYGNITSHGSFNTFITSNGYRGAEGKWVSLETNGATGASQIELGNTGSINFRVQADKPTGEDHTVSLAGRFNQNGEFLLGSTSESTGVQLYVTNKTFAGNDLYVGGTLGTNTFALWKSTLTPEELEQLEEGTLIAPANVTTPGDGEYARQWYYSQQDAETQAELDAGEQPYPTWLQARNFVDNFALQEGVNNVIKSGGGARFNGTGSTAGVVVGTTDLTQNNRPIAWPNSVSNATNQPLLQVISSNGGAAQQAGIGLMTTAATNANGPAVFMGKKRTADPYKHTYTDPNTGEEVSGAVVGNDVLGRVLFAGSNGVDKFLNGCIIQYRTLLGDVPDIATAGYIPGYLQVTVGKPDGNGGIEALRINSQEQWINTSFKVGIGTSDPKSLLHIADGVNTDGGSATNNQVKISYDSNDAYRGSFSYGKNSDGNWVFSIASIQNDLTAPIVLNPDGGNIGVGTSSPENLLHLSQDGPFFIQLERTGTSESNCTLGNSQNTFAFKNDGSGFNFQTKSEDTYSTALRILSNRFVGINRDDPRVELDVTGEARTSTSTSSSSNSKTLTTKDYVDAQIAGINVDPGCPSTLCYQGDARITGLLAGARVAGTLEVNSNAKFSSTELTWSNGASDIVFGNTSNRALYFRTNNTNRIKITDNGQIEFGRGIDKGDIFGSSTESGVRIEETGTGVFVRNGNIALGLNRRSTAGSILEFRQNGSAKGSVYVDGSNCIYYGTMGRSALLSIAGTLQADSEPLKRGTVLCHTYEATPYQLEGSEYSTRSEISSTVGDTCVAGVYNSTGTDSEDREQLSLSTVGFSVIRIAQGVTVNPGDLLESAGDGTAKPQADDIYRSGTIAKVVASTALETYDDGSYIVPCKLMIL